MPKSYSINFTLVSRLLSTVLWFVLYAQVKHTVSLSWSMIVELGQGLLAETVMLVCKARMINLQAHHSDLVMEYSSNCRPRHLSPTLVQVARGSFDDKESHACDALKQLSMAASFVSEGLRLSQ